MKVIKRINSLNVFFKWEGNMNNYKKPVVEIVPGTSEGIYTASGSGDKEICRFGRKEFNPNSDTCQACNLSGGLYSKMPGSYKTADMSCIDNMPIK